MPNYKIDKNVFSTADLSAILMGLSSLSDMIRGNELINALAKVKSFIPADQASDIELKTNQICIDLSTWIGNRNTQSYLETIKTALQDHRLVSFEYIAHHGKKTTRTVELYQLVLKSGHWYFQGYCLVRSDFRLFRLSRISNLHMETEHFSPDGGEYYMVDFPFIENEYFYDILLSFGDKCECLEPLNIRAEMKRRIHDIAAIYEN